MNKIYIYTTESDRKKGYYKIGQTQREVNSRVKESQTGNSESLETIGKFESEFSDHYIHDKLESEGYKHVGTGGREWFGVFGCDDEVVSSVMKILSKSTTFPKETYQPRFYQDYIKMVFMDKFQQLGVGKKDFAMELGPRFGKTLWSLDLIMSLQDNGFKICLLPAFVLTALSSFQKEFYKFQGFSDKMVFVDKKEDLVSVIDKYYDTKMIIIPVSLHEVDYQKVYESITKLPTSDKMSIIDESDFGCHRQNSQEFIKYLDCDLNIFMTGTAIEKVISPLDNIGDNIIRWSYSDMLMVKNGEHPIQRDLV
jgi:hypothetical protein